MEWSAPSLCINQLVSKDRSQAHAFLLRLSHIVIQIGEVLKGKLVKNKAALESVLAKKECFVVVKG